MKLIPALLILALPASAAVTDIVILQRDADNRNEEITITGSSNPWEAVGFNASGVIGPITLWDMTPSTGKTASKVLAINSGGTALEWATMSAGLVDGDYGDITIGSGGTLMGIDANSVVLATDTTGNYVATIADSGASEITVTGSGSENAAVTLAIASTIARDSEVAAGYQPLDTDLTQIAALGDPNADRLPFWDDSAGAWAYLTAGSGLTISGTTISATGTGSGDVSAASNFGTDNLLIRSDGTTKGVQSSGITVDDSNNVTGIGDLTVTTLNTTNLNAGNLVFEGATADAFEATLTVTDPTADRTWTFPDVTDTVVGLGATQTLTNKTISLGSNTLSSTSAQLRTALSDASGTGAAVFAGGDIGAATATTPAENDNDTSVATTAYVQTEIAGLSGGGGSISSFRQNVFIWEEFLHAGALSTTAQLGSFGLLRTTSGTGATVTVGSNGVATAPGVTSIETGTTNTGSAALLTDTGGFLFGSGTYTIEFRIWLPDLSDGTETYTLRVGFIDSATGDGADGCFFRYSNANANWICVARGTSTETADTSTTAVVEDAWIKLAIVVTNSTSAAYYVNGTLIDTIADANIPTTVGSERTAIGISINKSAGTTNRNVRVDYLGYEGALGAAR